MKQLRLSCAFVLGLLKKLFNNAFFRYIQLSGDLEDLATVLGKKNVNKVVGSGSCSAIIKLFPKNADLAISQVTWNDYVSMLRIYKLYNFAFHDSNGKIILWHQIIFTDESAIFLSNSISYICFFQLEDLIKWGHVIWYLSLWFWVCQFCWVGGWATSVKRF